MQPRLYANPLCSPSRATLLTGQHSFRTGIGYVLHGRARIGLPMFPAQLPIPIMLELGGAGYNHSQIGKRHLAPPLSNISCNPLDQGFNWTAGSTRNVTGVDGNYYSWMKQVNCEISRAEIYATTDATAQTFRPNGRRESVPLSRDAQRRRARGVRAIVGGARRTERPIAPPARLSKPARPKPSGSPQAELRASTNVLSGRAAPRISVFHDAPVFVDAVVK